MAYEVWLFEQQPTGPSRLHAIVAPQPTMSLADVQHWAKAVENDYAKEGLAVTAHVRQERTY